MDDMDECIETNDFPPFFSFSSMFSATSTTGHSTIMGSGGLPMPHAGDDACEGGSHVGLGTAEGRDFPDTGEKTHHQKDCVKYIFSLDSSAPGLDSGSVYIFRDLQ